MKRLCEEADPRRPFIEPPSTSSQVTARRRRRGLIEKRRRDRINDSLSELRRLVPPAFDKHGSAKLEKAEILQMTVEHLKLLQGVRGKSHLDALDFLSLGFRECVTEVSRCLSDEPLRSRLLSHLNACASQRDAFAFASHQPHPLPWLRPFHGHHWNAPLRPLPAAMAPYGLIGSPDAGGGASQRASGQSQSSVDSCPPSLAPSPFSVSQSFPAVLHGGFLPSAPQQQ